MEKIQVNTSSCHASMADIPIGTSAFSPKKAVGRDSTGRTWIAWINPALTAILAAYSDDQGQTWTEETVVSGTTLKIIGFNLLINSVDIPIVIYAFDSAAGDEIRYIDRSGGVWGGPETVHTCVVGNRDLVNLVSVIASTDIIYLCWKEYQVSGNPNLWARTIYYKNGSSGVWGGGVGSFVTGVTPNTGARLLDLVVDSVDNRYVFYSYPDYLLRVDVGGGFGAAEMVSDITPENDIIGDIGSLIVDGANSIYAVFGEGLNATATNKLYYNKRTAGVWAGKQLLSSMVAFSRFENPALSIDTADTVYIVYQPASVNVPEPSSLNSLYYRTIIAGVISAQTELETALTKPNGKSGVYCGLGPIVPASNIVAAAQHPIAVMLGDDGVGGANVFFTVPVAPPSVQTNPATGVT